VRRAFTIIEVLLAIALVTLAASVGAGLLLGATAAASVARAEAAVVHADRVARVLARSSGPVDVRAEAGLLTLKYSAGEATRLPFPRTVQVAFINVDGRPVEEIIFGRDGRTSDYGIHITTGETTSVSRVSGLTGWRMEIEE